MTPAQALATRMSAQRLVAPATDLRDVLALQAQDVPALTTAARNRGLSTDGIRTWAMRGTLHLLHPADAAWVVRLLGPTSIAAGKRRREQLGLDDGLCARALEALREILVEPKDRPATVRALAEVGIVLDPKSQAPAHLLAFAANSGVVHRGLDDTYHLLPKTDPQSDTKSATETGTTNGLPDLFRRYLTAYGPATLPDFAAWSGLSLRRVRQEIDPDDYADTGFGLVHKGTEPVEPQRRIKLLGHFDTYLLGYRDRTLALPAEHTAKIQTGGGFLTPHVLLDGLVVGTWREEGGEPVITPFVPARAAELRRLVGEDTR
ncbi:DNA glycosylase AlkZ-like family protein [Umezawaea tangerina]|uniref:Winged helix DNA-binding protein n=1 Tax=Umezawaea tangerina TaxID=84725 RepID=A0A2T0SSF6_9PSEU|nr:crosslink repair DNA glycosylase YcaQ family protein [Umezawaea tangerina]PRY36313.1 winged helix DNA-binding protein [Umezawaea tangerina]